MPPASTPAALIFASLPARGWAFRRELASRLEGSGVVEGEASFAPRGADELLYEECGIFRLLSGPTFDVRKTYLWRRRQDHLALHFDEPGEGLFHLVSLSTVGNAVRGACERHPCGDDVYESSYAFEVAEGVLGRWSVRHDVRGPTKDYTSITVYDPSP
jgi:hypothetical protein